MTDVSLGTTPIEGDVGGTNGLSGIDEGGIILQQRSKVVGGKTAKKTDLFALHHPFLPLSSVRALRGGLLQTARCRGLLLPPAHPASRRDYLCSLASVSTAFPSLPLSYLSSFLWTLVALRAIMPSEPEAAIRARTGGGIPVSKLPPTLSSSDDDDDDAPLSVASAIPADRSADVALIAFALGGLFSVSLTLALPLLLGGTADPLGTRARGVDPRLPTYLASWAAFHLLEFVITAIWNPGKVMVSCRWLRAGGRSVAGCFSR